MIGKVIMLYLIVDGGNKGIDILVLWGIFIYVVGVGKVVYVGN